MDRLVIAASCMAALLGVARAQDRNHDMFTYGDTVVTDSTRTFGPKDWQRVQCPDLDKCIGFPDGWETGVGWEIKRNYCRWCPVGKGCGTHHQSPIDLQRNRAVEGNKEWNECIDVHWMAYFDSTCTWSELRRNNAFTIERHALKITQPVENTGGDNWRIGCRSELGRRWGKIDFSKGFSQWWHLSHIDVHVPSEHTQEGKRYDGELQMYHFYSVSGEEAGVNNELASVTTFLEAYEDSEDYDVLNKVICQWRKAEDETREACGLPSVTQEYPGCFYYTRGHGDNPISTAGLDGGRKLRAGEKPILPEPRPKPVSAHDLMVHNAQLGVNETHKKKVLIMDEEDYKAETDFDWEAFIEKQYRMEEERKNQEHRHLMNYDHVGPWFNYFPMIGCKTEYYYRYSGTQTIPPCYGNFFQNAQRAHTNNWRVMKDPIRVSQRQIDEMHRLLKERVNPADAPIRQCRKDTAAKQHPDDPSKVWVARPLQSNHKAHHKVFCECDDWGSKFYEDKRWCRMKDKKERFYDHPYNYKTDGF